VKRIGTLQKLHRLRETARWGRTVVGRVQRFAVGWRALTLLVIVLCSTVLSGCYDYMEVSDMNIVVALGIDEMEDGQVRVTAQMVNPASVPSAGGQESGGGATVQPFTIHEETAPSMEEAMERLSYHVPHKAYLAHNTLMVFGESYARHGIDRVFDFVMRNRYFRPTQLWVVTQGRAHDVLTASTDPEPLNAFGIRDLIQQSRATTPLLDSEKFKVVNQYLDPSQTPVLVLVNLRSDGKPMITGTALLRGGKLADTLDLEETQALAWLSGNTRQTIIRMPCPKHRGEGGTTLRILRALTHVKPRFDGGVPHFIVGVDVRAEIDRLCPKQKLDESAWIQMEQMTEKDMRRQMHRLLVRLQSKQLDACQFGTRIFETDPKRWRQISDRWPSEFAQAKVDLRVHVHLVRSGLNTSNPENASSPASLPPAAGMEGTKS
jgi:spore germination protein KC